MASAEESFVVAAVVATVVTVALLNAGRSTLASDTGGSTGRLDPWGTKFTVYYL